MADFTGAGTSYGGARDCATDVPVQPESLLRAPSRARAPAKRQGQPEVRGRAGFGGACLLRRGGRKTPHGVSRTRVTARTQPSARAPNRRLTHASPPRAPRRAAEQPAGSPQDHGGASGFAAAGATPVPRRRTLFAPRARALMHRVLRPPLFRRPPALRKRRLSKVRYSSVLRRSSTFFQRRACAGLWDPAPVGASQTRPLRAMGSTA